jgi:hypothetical protein
MRDENLTIEDDMGRKTIWQNLDVDIVQPGYQWRDTDRSIRNSTRNVLVEYRGDVRVNLRDGGRIRTSKLTLIALSTIGLPPYDLCFRCGERIPYYAAQLYGQDLKWHPDTGQHSTCLEEIVQEKPHGVDRRHRITFAEHTHLLLLEGKSQ